MTLRNFDHQQEVTDYVQSSSSLIEAAIVGVHDFQSACPQQDIVKKNLLCL